MAWKNRIIGTGEANPEDLLANPLNFRRHGAAQRNALRGSLATVGWVQMCTVNQRTGFVVDGHARIEEAISRHEPTVPVIYVDLSPEEEKLVLASLDPISAMATHDQEALNDLLADLHTDDLGLQALLDTLNSSLPTIDEQKPVDKGAPNEVECPECHYTFVVGLTVKN